VLERLHASICKTIKGKAEVVEQVLVGLAAGGHLLIEDLPGLGKTTLAYALARSMDCSFSRIQFTSDLLPSDVTGVSIYDERLREFVFKKGPVFANIVLADEINRATPKTQSALLEVMDRARVTIDGEAHSAGSPFMVLATQNPVDYEGTFPLPESQMDRFLLRLHIGYPGNKDEMEILRSSFLGYDSILLDPVATRGEVIQMQSLVPQIYIEESVLDYILKVVSATRAEATFKAGVSVRGALSLKLAAQARALLKGRDFVMPEDVLVEAPSVLVHRLALARSAGDALEERRQVAADLRRIMASIPSPQ
jgi:MoxR-like ATPase